MATRKVRQAYRLTARRKAALRKAQIASARKRRRNKRIAVGVGVGAIALAGTSYVGYRVGSGKSIATDLRARDFSMTNVKNRFAARAAANPLVKEKVLQDHAVSPVPGRFGIQPMPSGLRNLNRDPLNSVPSEQQSKNKNKPNNNTPNKPDLAPDAKGNLSSKPQSKNAPTAPGRSASVQHIPAQTAQEGRRNMETQPLTRRNGGKWGNDSYEYSPKPDLWGVSSEFKPWSTDTILGMLPKQKITKRGVLDALRVLGRKQENLGTPLSDAQWIAVKKYYSRKFDINLLDD